MTVNQYREAFNQYRMPVFNFCNKLIGQRQDAEDATVLTFVSLWHYIDEVTPDTVKSFLMTTAKRKSLDLIKHNNLYKNRSVEVDENIEQVFDQERIPADVMQYIIKALESLPPRECQIIKMKYLQEMRQGQIAAELGTSVQTVANSITSGLKKLRGRINIPEILKRINSN
jgi:RNA polymerase sigma factor (sigma-70 family)